jgi:hypothetical protein
VGDSISLYVTKSVGLDNHHPFLFAIGPSLASAAVVGTL